MIKREYQEIDDGDDTDSLTTTTKVKKEIVQDSNMAISSAKTTPKKRAKSPSLKSTDHGKGEGDGESPNTPKSKSPAKSVSPPYLNFN